MNVRTARIATQSLAGICGGLLLLAVLQYAGIGRGYGWSGDSGDDTGRAAAGRIDNTPVQLPPESAFAAISRHPLFNDDREPTPVDATASGDEAAPPPSPLSVILTGVILDREVKIAMLQDLTRNQPVALRVGMPLEGDQASWTLVDVKPRGAVFRNAANETTEVELQTSVAQPPPPPRGGRANTPANTRSAQPPGQKQDANADLARRIEERRRKMREDAERLRGNAAQPKK